jgi:biotin transport system substrate-specific component
MTTAALLAALLAACAPLAIPLQPVPVTFQVLVVVLIALLLRPWWAFAAVAVYLALGAAGVPVFAGMQAGPGVLAGPTGGFLLGFLVAVGGASRLRTGASGAVPALLLDGVAAVLVIGLVYLFGWAQLAYVTGMGPVKALLVGVVPFLAFDALKAVAAVGVAGVLRRARVVPA